MVNLPDDAKEIFQGKNFAHVTSLMKDGSPQASAVWCEAVGNDIVINCDEKTIKVKNFRRTHVSQSQLSARTSPTKPSLSEAGSPRSGPIPRANTSTSWPRNTSAWTSTPSTSPPRSDA